MQPNQQDSNDIQQSTPRPQSVPLDPYGRPLPLDSAGSVEQGAPEYLHMEPIAEKKVNNGNKKRLFFVLLSILLVCSVIASAAYWILYLDSPESRLYRAIDASMQNPQVTRKYEILYSSQPDMKLTMETYSVASDQGLSSSVDYELSDTKNSVVLKGEQIIYDSGEVNAQVHQSDYIKGPSIKTDKWYTFNNEKVGNAKVSALDTLKLRSEINTPINYIITGVVSPSVRDQIIFKLKTENVYTVKNTSIKQLNNESMDVYEVATNIKKLNEIVSSVAQQLKVKIPTNLLSISNLDTDTEFWINKKDGRIAKFVYSTKQSYSDPITKGSMVMDYEPRMSIAIPNDTIPIE